MYSIDKAAKLLGNDVKDRLSELVIDYGELQISKNDLVRTYGSGNWRAARNVSRALRKLKLDTVKAIYKMDPFSFARLARFGADSFFVLNCILDHHGYSVERWWGWDKHDNVVKFSTFRHRAIVRAQKHKQVA
jgi:hypothetical protein